VEADVHVVHRLLAEPTFCQLPIQAADLKPVERLQADIAQSGTDVLVDAHAVIASGLGTDVVTSGEPVWKVFAEGASAALGVHAIDTISLVAGCLAIAVAVIALRRASSVLGTAIVSAIVGIALFNAVIVAAAQMASALSPPPLDAKAMAAANSPTIALSPPLVGMASLVIGVAAVLGMRRGISGHRPALAALIMGGATTFYWLFNLVCGLNAE